MSVAEIFETMEYGPAPESRAEADAWLDRHDRTFGHFVGGARGAPGETFDVTNPATGEALARVTQGSEADVATAVKAAAQGPARLGGA